MVLLSVPAFAQPFAVSALGKKVVNGEELFVDVLVVVEPGKNGRDVARAALARQGASLVSEDFTFTGLVWDSFPVVQNYNDSGEPGSLGGVGDTIVLSSQATWTDVSSSFGELISGGSTTRCPSLIPECPGDQVFDGFNDFAWLPLGPGMLGVTWFSTSIDEADVALSTNFPWFDDGGDFDAETVAVHENGHVLGVGHSPVFGAVMEPVYAGVRRTLAQDDIDAITCLYPETGECVCVGKKAACTTDVECCSGVCAGNGKCAGDDGGGGDPPPSPDCSPKFSACDIDGDCCSNKCKNGTCKGG